MMSKVKDQLIQESMRSEVIQEREMIYRMEQIASLERMLKSCSDAQPYTKGRIQIIIEKIVDKQPISYKDQKFLRQL